MKFLKRLDKLPLTAELLISAVFTSIALSVIRGIMYYGGYLKTESNKEMYALLQDLNSFSSSCIVFLLVSSFIYKSASDKEA